MPQSYDRPALYLKGGAVLFFMIGAGIIVWLADKAVRFPEVKASQLGYTAPLWIPSIAFVAVCTMAAVYIFWRAARRVGAGEDLYAQRHRRRPGTEDAPSA